MYGSEKIAKKMQWKPEKCDSSAAQLNFLDWQVVRSEGKLD